MCGFAGFLRARADLPRAELREYSTRMASVLTHRGPDDQGDWVSEVDGVALGFRRLSIIDLSPQGHQPMYSACGRFVIAFNGEIYNYQDLRGVLEKEARAPLWRGHSDTEVLLAAISTWGTEKALQNAIGMFAFALWDKQARKITLGRDRFGEKPLYYGVHRSTLLFGSELKALRAFPYAEFEIDRDALSLMLRYHYVPAPRSIYLGIRKLPPGTLLQLSSADLRDRELPRPQPYWTARAVVESGARRPLRVSDAETIERLDSTLRASIRRQMVADVPVGAFLSGGIDSSVVVALMQAESVQCVRTFTIGFEDADFNEAQHARAVARHLHTDHTELYVTADEAREVIPHLPRIYDEPFGDSSQIPTVLISRLARRHVTVCLSGDGGDELFGGYNRYAWIDQIWRGIRWMPEGGRALLADAITHIPPSKWNRVGGAISSILPSRSESLRNFGNKVHKLASILPHKGHEQIYLRLVENWPEAKDVVIGTSSSSPAQLVAEDEWLRLRSFIERMMYLDSITYLPDDILVKVDRAAMSASLETRIPYLDHHVFQFAWQLNIGLRVRKREGKWILKQLLHKYVPKSLVERPKMGFGVPVDSWLRGPLREWAESLLAKERLRREGFLVPDAIRALWEEHVSGLRNWHYHIWDVLMFQAWLEESAAR